MRQKNKIILGWIGFGFVIFHLSFLLVYAAPEQIMPPAAKNFVSPYVNPMFHQQWAMFAPCPEVEGHLEVQFTYADSKSEWIKPADNAKAWHKWIRVSHHAELVLLESNLIYWVNYDVDLYDLKYDQSIPNASIESFRRGRSSMLIERYIKRVGVTEEGIKPLAANVKVHLHNVRTDEAGVIEYPEFEWTD